VQFISSPDPRIARDQHDSIARALVRSGVTVHLLSPASQPPPNQMFAADLFFMTREGAILGRPASQVRAGEEVLLARKLTSLGIPIISSVRGSGTFEGADALWLDSQTVLIGVGRRTNREGFQQVKDVLNWLDAVAIPVDLPVSVMHLMGALRFADADLAIGWTGRLPETAISCLRDRGYRVEFLPDEAEAIVGHALNFATLGPRRILAPAGNPRTFAFYQDLGVECMPLDVSELAKAAGAIGCLTGILERSKS
jgi:N-dimethylarginine dimethylaminohydrolase